jgi:hypothetical protein
VHGWTPSDLVSELERRGWTYPKFAARTELEYARQVACAAAFDYTGAARHERIAADLRVVMAVWAGLVAARSCVRY